MSRIDGPGDPSQDKELGILFQGVQSNTVGETGADGEFRYNGRSLEEAQEWARHMAHDRANRGNTNYGDAWKDASGDPEAQGNKGEGPGGC